MRGITSTSVQGSWERSDSLGTAPLLCRVSCCNLQTCMWFLIVPANLLPSFPFSLFVHPRHTTSPQNFSKQSTPPSLACGREMPLLSLHGGCHFHSPTPSSHSCTLTPTPSLSLSHPALQPNSDAPTSTPAFSNIISSRKVPLTPFLPPTSSSLICWCCSPSPAHSQTLPSTVRQMGEEGRGDLPITM